MILSASVAGLNLPPSYVYLLLVAKYTPVFGSMAKTPIASPFSKLPSWVLRVSVPAAAVNVTSPSREGDFPGKASSRQPARDSASRLQTIIVIVLAIVLCFTGNLPVPFG